MTETYEQILPYTHLRLHCKGWRVLPGLRLSTYVANNFCPIWTTMSDQYLLVVDGRIQLVISLECVVHYYVYGTDRSGNVPALRNVQT